MYYASLPEVVGDAGCLVDPLDPNQIAEAIENVLTNNELCEDLVEKGFQRVKKFFLPDVWMKKTMFIYKEVLEK